MERLFAPWRHAFVSRGEGGGPPGPTGCIFCDHPRPWGAPEEPGAPQYDRERLVVHLRPHAFVMMNKFPYAGGHVMVVPRTHTDRLETLPAEQFAALSELLRDTVAVMRATYGPEGLNVGMNMGRAAGAGIADHVHWHVVPRWVGDSNFMPLLADTRVISESMLEAYERLKDALDAL